MFDLKKLLQGQNPFVASSSSPKPASTAQPKATKTQQLLAQAAQDNSWANNIGKSLGNFGKTVVSGVQQGAGNVADIALQGGATLGALGAQTNPFISQQRRDQQVVKQVQNSELLRNALKNTKTVTGESFNANPDYAPTGDFLRDASAVGGRALQTGLDATMFANPTRLLARGVQGAPVKTLLKDSARQAALYGGAQGAATGAETYGATGDLGRAVKSGITTGLVSGVTQGGLNTLGGLAGATGRNAVPAAKAVNKAIEQVNPQVKELDNTLANYQRAFDVETDPVRRAQINRGIAQVNAQRRNVLTRGSIQLPGSSDLPIVGANLNASEVASPLHLSNTADQLPQGTAKGRTTAQEQVPNQSSIPAVVNDSYGNGNINGNISKLSPDAPEVQPKTRFASKTAPNSGNLSPELAKKVRENASSYAKSTNAGSVEDSIKFLSERTEDEAIADVLTRLSQKNIDRQAVTDAIATASSLDARGGTRNLELAQNIYDQLSEQLTKAGQTVQAASIISRRTPEGMAYNALRELQRAEVKVTPEIRKQIVNKTNEIGKLKLGSEARERATAELQKEVNKLIPTEVVDKLVGTWKAGLLTGIRTTTGGALSNAIFRGLREVSRPGAVIADMAASLLTGKRSTALTSKGAWAGTAEGLKKAGKYLKSGVDERSFSADGKYIDREINFKNKALGTYVNGVFRVMGAADRPFYYSQFRNSIAEATIVEAKNLKLKGKAFDDYVTNGIKNPTDEAAQYATDVAEQAVLANDTLLSDIANKLRAAVSKQENKAVRFTGKAALGVLAPFTKVPSAFLSRVVDFTPIGAVKEAVTQMAGGKLNQAKLVQAISEAGTGTGLIYLGSELANNDLLTGNYPNDPKEQARWKTEGITPNSIKIGDTYYSLNYAGALGALFGIGKSIADTAKEGGDVTAALSAGAGQLASGTLEQSFLSGISGALDAVQDPKRYAENFVRSQAGSVVPTLLNDIGNVTDETQRQANSPLEALQGRLPVSRTGLQPKLDSFGKPIEQANPNAFPGRLVDPFRPSKERSTVVTKELDRLKDAGQSIFPTNDKSLTAGGKTIKLSGEQQTVYNSEVGKETELIWKQVLNNDEYKSLNDADKKKMLENSSGDINTVIKKAYLYSIGENAAADAIKLTKRQENYALGTIDPLQWLPNGSEPAKQIAADKKAEKTSAKASNKTDAKKSTSKAKSGKFDYAKLLETTSSTARNNQDALRKLVYGSKITRKKIG